MKKNGQLKDNFLGVSIQYSANEKRDYLRTFFKWLKKNW